MLCYAKYFESSLDAVGWADLSVLSTILSEKKTGREFAALASEWGANIITNVSGVFQGVGKVPRLAS